MELKNKSSIDKNTDMYIHMTEVLNKMYSCEFLFYLFYTSQKTYKYIFG